MLSEYFEFSTADFSSLYDNKFIFSAVNYYKILLEIKKRFKDNVFGDISDPLYADSFLTRRKLKLKEFDTLQFSIYYSQILEFFKNYNDYSFDEIMMNIYKYIDFLSFAEKCFMYHNSDDVYCTCDSDDNVKELAIINDKYEISITFVKSKIDSNNNKSSLLGFMYDNNESDKVIFIDIQMTRKFGHEIISNYKFIMGEDPECKNIEDKIIFNNILSIIIGSVSDNYTYIMNNYIFESSKILGIITAKEILEGNVVYRK